jgi:type IV secretory pathway TrbL component
MRLLLLLSAFLTALTGVVVGSAASAQPIVASTSATHAKVGNAVTVTAPVPEEVRGAFAAPGTWHARSVAAVPVSRKSYGERRRE